MFEYILADENATGLMVILAAVVVMTFLPMVVILSKKGSVNTVPAMASNTSTATEVSYEENNTKEEAL